MVNIAPNPFIIGDCTLKVGADNYEASVSGVEFVPTPVKAVFKGLTPTAKYPIAGSSDWVAKLAYAQDWATADSLSRYLYEHEGESIEVEFAPVAGGPAIVATLTIVDRKSVV